MLVRIFLGVIAAFALNLDAIAADKGAVNLAGQQRMLSQRIVKSYSQIGLNVLPERSRFQLDEAIRMFDDNLKPLSAAATTDATRSSLEALVALWNPMRTTASGKVELSQARKLDLQAESVLQAADQLALELQEMAASPEGRWVNLAGRQRMLSQRLVKAYMLRQWGIESANLRQQMESAANEFSGALESLQRLEKSPAVRAELDSLTVQWGWMQASLASEGAVSYRLILAEGSDSVLDLADRVTELLDKP
jgi:hypothetical protein